MKLLYLKPDKDYLLLPDLILDGISQGPVRGQAVFISRGVITQIVPSGGLCDSALECVETVRLDGVTLMPGLVDCHVHFSMNCKNLFKAIEDWENRPGFVKELAREAAEAYLSSGVLAVRDGSDKTNIGLDVRNSIDSGLYPGPLVTATGWAIYRKEKYGTFLGPGITDIAEALEQVNVLKQNGADQLKVVVSGLVSFKEYGNVGPLQFSVSELKQVTNMAHCLDMKVMAHASSAAAVETAVLAGVDSIEHGYFLETEQLELMAGKGTAWVPTLAPLGNLVTGNHIPYEGADMDVIRKSFEDQLIKLYEAHKLGVRIGIGTDAGANHVPHGSSYHDELRYYSDAGLSNAAILGMATSISAGIIGRENEIGKLSAGKKPFLIGVMGDPFQSLSVLREPALVLLPSPSRS